jgi:hypothetical protein
MDAPHKRTQRLTFAVANGAVRLVSRQRLDMICPPQPGPGPEAGRSGGFWVELLDARGKPLFQRVMAVQPGLSAEVHDPQGGIERVFGAAAGEVIFEVLLPDLPEARSVTLMGQPWAGAERQAPSVALARFDLPEPR